MDQKITPQQSKSPTTPTSPSPGFKLSSVPKSYQPILYILIGFTLGTICTFACFKLNPSRFSPPSINPSISFSNQLTPLPAHTPTTPTPTTPTPPPQEKIISDSTTYNVDWDPNAQLLTFNQNSTQLYQFSFSQKPIAAWYYPPNQLLILVSVNLDESVQDAHQLFLYNGSLQNPINGEKIPICANKDPQCTTFSREYLYNTTTNQPNSSMNQFFRVSPDNHFLTFSFSGYESNRTFTVNLNTFQVQSNTFGDLIYWSPDSNCAVNLHYGYGIQNLSFTQYSNQQINNTIPAHELSNFMDATINYLKWKPDCQGYLSILEIGDTITPNKTSFLEFSIKNNSLIKLDQEPDVSSLKDSIDSKHPENIFFTIIE